MKKYFLQDSKTSGCLDTTINEINTSNIFEAIDEAENLFYCHLTASERKHRMITVFEADLLEDVEEQNCNCKLVWDSSRWECLSTYMNDEIREQVHEELAPCSTIEFLKRYLELDPEFIETIKQEFDEFLKLI